MTPSRTLLILHPNTSRVDITVTDKRFNNEQYSFSRKKAPTGHEERMLRRLEKLGGIKEAKAGGFELHLELRDGFFYKELMPAVIEIVREFTGPDYGREMFVQDRRRIGEKYDNDGYLRSPGVKPERPDLGFEYQDWVGDNPE